jgi:hypothetical protein
MDIEYPVVAYPLVGRIAGAVTAYACGDALGLPWERFPPTGASTAEIEALPAREDALPGDPAPGCEVGNRARSAAFLPGEHADGLVDHGVVAVTHARLPQAGTVEHARPKDGAPTVW